MSRLYSQNSSSALKNTIPLQEQSFRLGVLILSLVQELRKQAVEQSICDQLVRAGTAPGALVCEASEAESPKDMSHKFGIALKEARETSYWLQLLVQGVGMNENDLSEEFETLNSVTAMLVASRITLKKRISKK